MKRRDFFKKGTAGAVAASMVPLSACGQSKSSDLGDRDKDQWHHLGKGTSDVPKRKETKDYDVVVLGGGIGGICAAVAAARNGSKTVLVQDRPVLGGNASSEMRVHVQGVSRLVSDGKPERETGILEEILLHNRFYNPQESYPVWDHILYDFVKREERLDLMLNTQAVEAIMDGNTIKAARCWQMTTEKEFVLNGKMFVDCSGDGLLAATAGALYRTGREAAAEFDEDFAPEKADGWQMGATLLIQAKDMGKPVPFKAPPYAIKYDGKKMHKGRKFARYYNGIWWIEVGDDDDIIAEAENIRDKLMGYLYGVWDYIKNSGEFPEAENMALDWVQSLPGRRESRRFIGDYILSEKDLTGHKHFEDAVAFGGWPIDEHCWAGIENPADPPSYWHHHFKEIYEIPYRSLYSKNIANLLFAGRNISQTHIALSSTRVISTCSLQGQAAGTAANLCVQKSVSPRDIYKDHLSELQENLLRDDAYIPKRPAKDASDLARSCKRIFASSTASGDAKNLINGTSRDIYGEVNHWMTDQANADVQLEWEEPISLSKVEVKCDTNLKKVIMMLKESPNDEKHCNTVPPELLKSMKVEAMVNGAWKQLAEIDDNMKRLMKFAFESVKTKVIRITPGETYGAKHVKLFEVRCYQ